MQFQYSPAFLFRHPVNPFAKEVIDSQTLYLASPVLLEELTKDTVSEKQKLSLKKYQQRASTRCTPFGLFAGCGVGDWGDESHIQKQQQFRHTRLDMNVVCEIALLLSAHPAIKTYLTYFINNSLYAVADKYRYVEYSLKDKYRNYQITSIDASPYLNNILALTKAGASYATLVQSLLSEEVSKEEADTFIEELTQAQVLVTNLYPNVTGKEFYSVILETLQVILFKAGPEHAQAILPLYNLLTEIEKDIKQIDVCFENEVSVYKSIYAKLKQLLPDLTEENLFQTDLYFKTNAATLKSDVQKQITYTLSFLDKLYAEREPENLKKFKERFQSRYEDREVPLLQVLDTANGIGYLDKDSTGINPLTDDIGYGTATANDYDVKWNVAYSLLLKKLIEAQKEHAQIIELNDEDIKGEEEKEYTLPPSLSVMFSLISKANNTIYFKNAGGSSASNLLGRFAHGNKEIQALIHANTEHETQFHADKIIAEIVHLPESRIGNILLRPHTHKYEIPYLANSITKQENTIDLNDLMVSVQNSKIVLRSQIYNKEVIPRLTSAHNFGLSTLPVYQFLCDMQTQYYDKTGFSFHWGPLANEFDFLPRAVYKNVILEPASWNVPKEKMEELINCTKQYDAEKVKAWQVNLHLPDRFLLADGDNELFVNINDELSVKAFAGVVKKRESITLHEFLYDEKDSLVSDENGNAYTNEIIAVLLNQEKPTQAPIPEPNTDATKRSFTAGSEWLYYKIYGNSKFLEEVLTEKIYPLLQQFKEQEQIVKWFFIRYADPDVHIRLRLKLNDTNHLSDIQVRLNDLLNPLLETNLIEKVQLDTYNRELERYGFDNVEDTETLFYYDSENTLRLISELNNDEQGVLIKLKYACLSTYTLLTGIKLTADKITTFISNAQQSYFQEHGGSKDLKFLLDDKYRKYRKEIDTILTYTQQEQLSEEDSFIAELCTKQMQEFESVLGNVIMKENAGKLKTDFSMFIHSLIHMHVNRLFQNKQRTYELLMYDFLQRSLKSIEARKKKAKPETKKELINS